MIAVIEDNWDSGDLASAVTDAVNRARSTLAVLDSERVQVGSWVRGLSHRGVAVRHGRTVVIEGVVENITNGDYYVLYASPIELEDGTVQRHGYFREHELTQIDWRSPRGK
jgi:hypothetical protein